jgi:competence protein ComEA
VLNRGDQLFVAAAVSVMLALMLVHWLRLSGWGLQPVEIERLEPLEQSFRIDVNQATWVEWSQLDGVGPVLARRIVADREERGPFHSIDDVQRVKGVGPKTLEQLRPWLTIDPLAVDK